MQPNTVSGVYPLQEPDCLTALLELTPAMIAVLDRRRRLVAFNAALSAHFVRGERSPPEPGQDILQTLAAFFADSTRIDGYCRRALDGEVVSAQEQGCGQWHDRVWRLQLAPVRGPAHRPELVGVCISEAHSHQPVADLLDGLLEASPDAMLVVRHDGIIDRINRFAEQMFGYEPGELVGASVETLVPERLRSQHAAHRRAFHDNPRPRPMGCGYADIMGARADGSELAIDVSLTPMSDDSGGSVVAAIRDVTRARETTKALEHRLDAEHRAWEESEERFKSLADNIAQLTWIADADGWIFWFNRRWFEYTGTTLEQMQGWGWRSVHHPDWVDHVVAKLSDCFATGEPWEDTFPLRGADGEYRWFLSRAMPFRDKDGDIQRWFGTNTDITEQRETEQALRRALDEVQEQQQILDTVMEHIPMGITVASAPDTAIRYVSRFGREILGAPPDEILGVGADGHTERWQIYHSDGVTPATAEELPLTRATQLGEVVNEEEWAIVSADGKLVPILCTAAPITDHNGRVVGGVIGWLDMTQRKRVEQELHLAERRLSLAVALAELGLWEWDLETNTLYKSREYKRQLGYRDDELRASYEDWRSRLHPDDRSRVLRSLSRYLERPEGEYRFEFRLRHRDGNYRWFASRAAAETNAAGKAVRLIGTQIDITEHKRAQRRIRVVAQHDHLTGLPNRNLVVEYTRRLIAAAKRGHAELAILFIDIDRLKPINDTYGHEVGDKVLKRAAKRIASSTRQEDLVGRIGGDEFVVVMPHIDNVERAAVVARHVIDAFASPIVIGEIELSVSPSIGISSYPSHGRDVSSLLSAADRAMYAVKSSRRGDYQLYSAKLGRGKGSQASLELALRDALKRGALELHYQPIVDMQDGQLVNVEALVRMKDKKEGLIEPLRFIGLAERAGLMKRLSSWVTREACRQHMAWSAQGLPPVSIALNISPTQFREPAFADRLIEVVKDSGMEACHLQVEITESSVMEDSDASVHILARLKSSGISVVLDDFGTGFSNLSRLSQLPLDSLKVDKSFIRDLFKHSNSQAIIEAIIALAGTLHMDVVGEGVETLQASNYLLEHGCRRGQGFYFSEPLPADQFVKWYRRQQGIARGRSG